LFCFRC